MRLYTKSLKKEVSLPPPPDHVVELYKIVVLSLFEFLALLLEEVNSHARETHVTKTSGQPPGLRVTTGEKVKPSVL